MHDSLTPQQGDLGHTDLQEDLEFHPSSECAGDVKRHSHADLENGI